MIRAGLSSCWLTPGPICSRHVRAPPRLAGPAAATFAAGVFPHFVSDMHEHVALELRPGLVRSGLLARVRNPNWLGELLIYAGFGMLASRWAWVTAIAPPFSVGVVWLPDMRRKDRSLARHPEFEEYRRRTSLFLPGSW